MTDRLPPLPEAQWDAEQRAAAEEVIRGPRGALVSPFLSMVMNGARTAAPTTTAAPLGSLTN